MADNGPEMAEKLNPAALPVADAARILGLPEETLLSHVKDGAPVAADGAINLVHYAAWLNQRLADGD